jgi:hypothetical protein
MGPFRKLLLVGVGVLALHSVQACSNDTELNPQPLPPQGGTGLGDPTQSPDPSKNSGGDTTSGAGGSGNPTPPMDAADAGTEGGDAADGGDG